MNTCVVSIRTLCYAQFPCPIAFLFKEERVLAAHPPSCHPWRVFGCPVSEKKKRKRDKRRKSGKAESFPPILLLSKKFPFVTVHRSLYTAPAKQNYKKNQNQKLLQGTILEENQKVTKRSKKGKRRRKSTVQDE